MGETPRRLWAIVVLGFRADPWRAAGTLALNGVGMGTAPLVALWLKLLVNGVLAHDQSQVIAAAVLLGVNIGVGVLAGWAGLTLTIRLIERTSHHLDGRLIELSAGVAGIEHHERPDYLDDMDVLRQQRGVLVGSFQAVSGSVAVALMIASTAFLLGRISPLLLLLPLFGVATVAAGARDQQLTQAAMDVSAEDARRAHHLFELATTPGPAKELRIFGLGRELLRRHRQGWAGVDRVKDRASLRGLAITAAGWLVFVTGYALAIFFVVLRAVHGEASVGDVILTVSLAGEVNLQVTQVVGTFAFMAQCLAVARRYLWLVDYAAAARTPPAGGRAPVPARLADGIDLVDVSFRYPHTDVDVLSHVDLHLPAGSTVAVVGDNGAGKTTLVKLLCRFYAPTSGRITVDGADLRSFDVAEWRACLSAGFQDVTRFELLARQTVGVGRLPDIDDEPAVHAALDRASAADVMVDLPDGLGSQLGRSFDGGVELSGGQWQKLALGRAMMRPAPLLLVLDEPTASLDAQTEHALFERYGDAAKSAAAESGAITVLVSHRFSTVRMADVILVVDGGRVVEMGSHQDLVSAGGLYAELYELQARAYR